MGLLWLSSAREAFLSAHVKWRREVGLWSCHLWWWHSARDLVQAFKRRLQPERGETEIALWGLFSLTLNQAWAKVPGVSFQQFIPWGSRWIVYKLALRIVATLLRILKIQKLEFSVTQCVIWFSLGTAGGNSWVFFRTVIAGVNSLVW